MLNKVLIIGAGAFGTSLAACIASEKNKVTLLARSDKNFSEFKQHPILQQCEAHTFDEFKTDFSEFQLILFSVPCQSLRSVCEWMRKRWTEIRQAQGNNEPFAKLNFISTAKGIEKDTLLLPYEILESFWQENASVASLSGPSFAKEMLERLPTCVVLASRDKKLLEIGSSLLHASYFRVYDTEDIIGVEIGGALKNVIAMAAGGVDGLKLGNNARAAVITRGLAEIARVGVKLGADPLTFLGLSGVGDLILTCTGDLSRNRQLGLRLALGEKAEDIVRTSEQVIEGFATAQSAYELCHKLGVKATILNAVYHVLYKKLTIKEAVDLILGREQSSEFKWE